MTRNITPRISRDDAISQLRKDYGIRAGSTIYTQVLHVSRSGMTRTIGAYVARKGEVHNIGWLVAAALGDKWDSDNGGVVVHGAGMDMTFHLVYSLSSIMFPKGHRCTGREGCPSNDHSNDWGTAHRAARAELEAEGVDVDDRGARSLVLERAAEIRERDGLTYRKGRVHRSGGYALNRDNL